MVIPAGAALIAGYLRQRPLRHRALGYFRGRTAADIGQSIERLATDCKMGESRIRLNTKFR